MGATAAIAIGGYGLKKLNDYNNATVKRGQAKALAAGQQAAAVLTPPVIPPMPSTADANAAAGKAMTEAAMRYRKMQGAGVGATILTSPMGTAGTAGQAPVTRKSLLGL